jgi:hypothetical protein
LENTVIVAILAAFLARIQRGFGAAALHSCPSADAVIPAEHFDRRRVLALGLLIETACQIDHSLDVQVSWHSHAIARAVLPLPQRWYRLSDRLRARNEPPARTAKRCRLALL